MKNVRIEIEITPESAEAIRNSLQEVINRLDVLHYQVEQIEKEIVQLKQIEKALLIVEKQLP